MISQVSEWHSGPGPCFHEGRRHVSFLGLGIIGILKLEEGLRGHDSFEACLIAQNALFLSSAGQQALAGSSHVSQEAASKGRR